jgi:tartrate-resistant acid phosphatase type 5
MCSRRSFRRFVWLAWIVGCVVSLVFLGSETGSLAEAQAGIRFAVIGDYGAETVGEAAVAAMVRSWNPDFVITAGDNIYPDGSAAIADRRVGQYYHSFIYPYAGSYGPGATTNRFFPSLGNHDWETPGVAPYLAYFTLPGNERYYDFIRGPVHLFALDSDPHEPDGTTSTSLQATWLRNGLANSRSPWKLVYFHHSPYSSGSHGNMTWMQWPYQAWGATAVLSGHDHDYERIVVNGFPYFVVGLGGQGIRHFRSTLVPGSQVQYNDNYGAMLVEATADRITFTFISVTGGGTVIDHYTIQGTAIVPIETPTPVSAGPGTTSASSAGPASAPLVAPLCADLSGVTNPIIRADVLDGTVTDGSVFCRVIAQNGTFVQEAAEIGNAGVLNQGVIQAVDVFGMTHGGASATRFNSSVKVCLQGNGRFLYLDATTQPRALSQLPTTSEGGYTCALIFNAGTVALVP